MKITNQELKRLQALPLPEKIAFAERAIRAWHEAWDGAVYIAFSGGKDSTVLLDIVRNLYPDVPAVFSNTGLEYPEIVQFVKTIDNVEIIRPKMPFNQVIKKWGWPVVSKRISDSIYKCRSSKNKNTATYKLRMTGITTNGKYQQQYMIPNKWKYLLSAPFKVSDKCCDELKKKPFKTYSKITGRLPYVGTMASDSKQREQQYIISGCNLYDSKTQLSKPLSIFTEGDIWQYIASKNMQYSKIYDMGYSRTGCMFCMFGVHLESTPNKFQVMKKTHPKQWDYCINKLGCGEVLSYIGVPYEDKQYKLWE